MTDEYKWSGDAGLPGPTQVRSSNILYCRQIDTMSNVA